MDFKDDLPLQNWKSNISPFTDHVCKTEQNQRYIGMEMTFSSFSFLNE